MLARRHASPTLLGLLVLLAGCGAGHQELEAPRFAATFAPSPLPAPTAARGLAARSAIMDPFAPRPGHTYATIGGGDGVQIEYFAPDGRAFLWYPGNDRVVPGFYRYAVAEEQGEAPRLAAVDFRYLRYEDGVAVERGDAWSGQGIEACQSDVISYVPGDPFGLADGPEVPFVKTRCQLPAPMVSLKDTGGWVC